MLLRWKQEGITRWHLKITVLSMLGGQIHLDNWVIQKITHLLVIHLLK